MGFQDATKQARGSGKLSPEHARRIASELSIKADDEGDGAPGALDAAGGPSAGAELLPVGPGVAASFKKTTHAVQRRKNEQERGSLRPRDDGASQAPPACWTC